MDKILIRGARTHNLKNIDLTLPRDKLIVITGLSGSGKSSLAFDTLYAEGQRRYVESLSAYARQFLSMMEKPDVDTIEGLSPAISIEQKSTSHNPRSTVGTITEIYDYLRLLYARVGIPRCPDHDIPLEAQTVSQMVDLVLAQPEGAKLMLLAPVIRERKGEHLSVFEELRAQGFVRARINGKLYELDEAPKLRAKVQRGKRMKKTLKRVAGVTLRLAHAGSSTALKSDPAGLALVDAIGSETGVGMKWPNDLVYDGRKLCGILAEAVDLGDNPAVVIGLGLNTSLRTDELPVAHASSLELEGIAYERNELAVRVLTCLHHRLSKWERNDAQLMDDYRAVCVTLGQDVRAILPGDKELLGRATAVNEEGHLIITDEAGTDHEMAVGDIIHLRQKDQWKY